MSPFLKQSHPTAPPRQRLAWIEGIRIFAAVLILVYHYQLLFTDYAFAPQPTGLGDNLTRLWAASGKLGSGWARWASLPGWFGYQFGAVAQGPTAPSPALSASTAPADSAAALDGDLARLPHPLDDRQNHANLHPQQLEYFCGDDVPAAV
jgi:hypothetical protein